MKHTTVNFPTYDFNIERTSKVCLLGSCFSENLTHQLQKHYFDFLNNPLGIQFNPISISQLFLSPIDLVVEGTIQRQDIWLNWHANATIYSTNEKELKAVLTEKLTEFRESLKKMDVVFITFGSAWVYELKSTNTVVSNCHKFDSELFHKKILSSELVISIWDEIIKTCTQLNPQLKFVFTVSPVRHIKDGLIENQQSKDVLLTAIHQLISKNKQAYYFPAYEYFIDELRDYAFFQADGIHPNDLAIARIWSKFKTAFFSDKTMSWVSELERLLKQVAHQSIHPESKEAQNFAAYSKKQLADFLSRTA